MKGNARKGQRAEVLHDSRVPLALRRWRANLPLSSDNIGGISIYSGHRALSDETLKILL